MRSVVIVAALIFFAPIALLAWLHLTHHYMLIRAEELKPGTPYVGMDGKRHVDDEITLRCTVTSGFETKILIFASAKDEKMGLARCPALFPPLD
jgi:hypothetical protein